MSAVLVSCEKTEINNDWDNNNTEEQPENPTFEISVSPSELTFGAEGGEQVITITSFDKWTLDKSDDWCSASSYSGDSEDEVVIKVEPYDNTEESREIDLIFICGDKTASLNITQFPDEIIEFEDDNFLQALLKNNRIDKNEDGKISKSEASAQKSIIVGRSNISIMDEIKYFTSLEQLVCYDNQLTSLDLSDNPSLIELYCNDNQLLTINLSKNTALTTLMCEDNQLPFLDLSNNRALNQLSCFSNRITELDLSQCHELEYVECCQFFYIINNNYQFYPDYSTKLPLKSLKIYKYHIIDAPYIIALETFYQGIIEYVD